MNEIRQEIKQKGYSYNMLSFSEISGTTADTGDDISIPELEQHINFLNSSCEVKSYRPLTGNKLFVFIKKVIRKLTTFYVEPIVASQNEVNIANIKVLSALFFNTKKQTEADSEQEKIIQLADKLNVLELKLKTASSEIETLTDRIASLEKENSELKTRGEN